MIMLKKEGIKKNSTNIDLEKKSFKVPEEGDVKDSKSFDFSYLPILLEKITRYYDEVRDLDNLISIILYDELRAFQKTNIDRTIELLNENQHKQTPDCPGILDISKLSYFFNEIQKSMCEKYKSWDSLLEKPLEFELLDINYINQLFEKGDIKKSIDLKEFKKAKKSPFENVPISILVDMEISLLNIKDNCFRYCVKIIDRCIENKIFLLSEIKNLKGSEKFEKLKEVLKQFDLDYLENVDLKKQISIKDLFLIKKKVVFRRNIGMLARLDILSDYIMGKRKITMK